MEGRGRGEEPGEPGAAPAAQPDAGATLVFFDLDGTLVVGQTQRLLVSYLRRRGLVSRRFMAGTGLWFAGYKLGLLKATEQARARGAVLFRGRSIEEVDLLMEDFVRRDLEPRLHLPAVRALERHLDGGDRVVILSAAFDVLVAALARRLGVRDYLASPLEAGAGVFTGRLAGRALYGAEKARRAQEVMNQAGFEAAACVAYADHETDLDLLGLVGHPIVVRGHRALLRTAAERGWTILPDE